MDTIHQVVLSNFPSIEDDKWTSIMIDTIKPKDATRCFMCVDKFVGYYPIQDIKFDFIEIYCDAVQNSYRYQGDASSTFMAVRNKIIDSFQTTDITDTVHAVDQQNVHTFRAHYNVINNRENWLEIPIDRLNSLKFSFRSGTNAPAESSFNLHLKFKFQ